jgi:phospholipid/cholesterol/gamma-HCH transport system permease protein
MITVPSLVLDWISEKVLHLGRITLLFIDAVRWAVIPPYRIKNVLRQIDFVGTKSLSIIIPTGAFTGMVLALQGYLTFRHLNSESLVGATVAVGMAREMGPVIAAIMVIARAGSAMAAEIGTMRVTEQIDALTSMSINPVKYLVVPRILAGITMMPVLASIFSLSGFIASYFVSVVILHINGGDLLYHVHDMLEMKDYTNGMIKCVFFGLFLTLIGCYYGFYAERGAEGVGRATTRAVVVASVTIVVADYILTAMMFK